MNQSVTIEIESRIRSLPCWNGVFEIAVLRGGLSNESFLVSDANGRSVVRFGRDFPFHHVFRDREVATARAAHAAGFAPKVSYSAPGVMVSEFVEARTFDAGDVQGNIDRIAELVLRFHTVMPGHVRGAGFMFWVFHVIRDYAGTLNEAGSRWASELPDFLVLAREFERAQIPMPVIFGHNDLLPANFLDDGKKLWLIDFEYAGFSTAMFDLAGVASNALMPPEQSLRLVSAYCGVKPDRAFLQAHEAMQCASLLREAMWAMVSEIHLDAPGVDYSAYAGENLARLYAAIERYRTNYGKNPA